MPLPPTWPESVIDRPMGVLEWASMMDVERSRGWLGGIWASSALLLTIAPLRGELRSTASPMTRSDAGPGAVAPACLHRGLRRASPPGQNGPWDIVVDETSAYFTNTGSGTVMKVPLAGGAVTTLASAQERMPRLTSPIDWGERLLDERERRDGDGRSRSAAAPPRRSSRDRRAPLRSPSIPRASTSPPRAPSTVATARW